MDYTGRTVAYATLGCRLNFAETSTLAHRLAMLGFERWTPGGAPADLLVVNTCAVTEQATAKCRQQLRRLMRVHPLAYVVVTGCYAQIDAAGMAAAVGGIDVIVGTEYKGEHIVDVLGDLSRRAEPIVLTTATAGIQTFHGACSTGDDRTRYFLKVQDGCDYYCSYCTIPMARGRSRNAPIAQLVDEAERVAAGGGREIVLTGVNIGDFGSSSGETFFDLCRALDGVRGIERYRVGSVEPNLLTDELITWIATESQRFAPHFHLPLQAGSDEVLRLMRRRYDTRLFVRRVEQILRLMPDAFIGVDVMAGMRGETAALFEQGYALLSSLPVAQLHPFTYSERTGTRALSIEPVVPMPERHERTARLVALSEAKLRDFYLDQRGTERRVIWEQPSAAALASAQAEGGQAGGQARAVMMHGFTENYVRAERPYDPALVGQCQRVVLGQTLGMSHQGPTIDVVAG